MGNTTIQRLLSESQDELTSLWKTSFNPAFGAKIFLSKENEDLIQLMSSKQDENVKSKLQNAHSVSQDIQKSRFEQNFDRVRPLIESSLFDHGYSKSHNFDAVWNSNILKNAPNLQGSNELDEYRLNICCLIHTWSFCLSRTFWDENKDDPKELIKLILEAQEKEIKNKKSGKKNYCEELLILTFNIFAHKFIKDIDEGNHKQYLTDLDQLQSIINCVFESEDSKEIIESNDEFSRLLREKFKDIAMSLLGLIRKNENISQNKFETVINILIQLVFFLGSVQLHLLFLFTIKDNPKIKRLAIKLPEKLQSKNIAMLPLIWADQFQKKDGALFQNMQSYKLNIEQNNESKYYIEKMKVGTPIILSTDSNFIVELYNPHVIMMFPRKADVDTLKLLNSHSSDGDEYEIFKTCVNKRKGIEFFAMEGSRIGNFNLNSLVVADNLDMRIDKHWSLSGSSYLCEPGKKIKEDFNTNCQEATMLLYKDLKHTLSLKVFTCTKKDKPEGYEFIKGHDLEDLNGFFSFMIFEKSGGRWLSYTKETILKIGNRPFNPPKDFRETCGFYKTLYIRSYIYMYNKNYSLIVDPETCQVLNFRDNRRNMNNYPKAANSGDPMILPPIHGFEVDKNEIYYISENKMNINSAEFILDYNVALHKRLNLEHTTKETHKKKQLMGSLGFTREEEQSSSDEDEEDTNILARLGGVPLSGSDDQQSTNDSSEEHKLTMPRMNDIEGGFHFHDQTSVTSEEFYYSYVDYLLRYLFVTKNGLSGIADMSSQRDHEDFVWMSTLLFDKDRIENKLDVYKTILYLINSLKDPASEKDSALFMYLMKSLENHISIVSEIQLNEKRKAILLTQKFLKKLISKIKALNFSENKLLISLKRHLETSQTRIITFASSLLRKRKDIDTQGSIINNLTGAKTITFDMFMKELVLLNPSKVNTLLKVPVDNFDEEITEILTKFSELSKALVLKEIDLLKNVATSVYNRQFDRFTDKKNLIIEKVSNWTVQANMIQFFNAFLGFCFRCKLSDSENSRKNSKKIFKDFIQTISDQAIKLLQDLKLEFVQLRENSPDEFQKILTGFDSFFTSSFVGNLISLIMGMNEFIDKKNNSIESELLGDKYQQVFIEVIKIVNILGPLVKFGENSLVGEEPTKMMLNFSKHKSSELNTEIHEFQHKQPTSYDFRLDPALKKIVKDNYGFVQIYNQSTSGDEDEDDEETSPTMNHLIHTWTPENCDSVVSNYLVNNDIYITYGRMEFFKEGIVSPPKGLESNTNSKSDESESGELLIIRKKNNWRSSLSFVNLAKICLSNLSSSLIKKAKKGDKDSENKEEFTETTLLTIDQTLSSNLFENGLDESLYHKYQPRIAVLQGKTRLKIEDVSRAYWAIATEFLELSPEEIKKIQLIAEFLKKQVIKKNLLAKLGGEIGDISSKLLFMIILKHTHLLDHLRTDVFLEVGNLESSSLISNLVPVWLECSNIRKDARMLQTSRDHHVFFQKLLILLFTGPSEEWLMVSEDLEENRMLDDNSESIELTLKRAESRDTSQVKSYLKKLRKNSVGFRANLVTPFKTIANLVEGFVKIPTNAQAILKLLQTRKSDLEKSEKLFKFFLELLPNSDRSVLAPQILDTFGQIFRAHNRNEGETSLTSLNFLTKNYNGLPRDKVMKFLSIVKEVIRSFIDVLCCDNSKFSNKKNWRINNIKNKLKALQNLKWDYKGRETEIVTEIDVEKIWKNNFAENIKNQLSKVEEKQKDLILNYHRQLNNSFLELVEILMRYCSRKINELNQTSKTEHSSFNLRRQNSTIDENKMANILNRNLKMLIKGLKIGLQELSEIPSYVVEDYQKYLATRMFENLPANLASGLSSHNSNAYEFTSYEFVLNKYIELLPKKRRNLETGEVVQPESLEHKEEYDLVYTHFKKPSTVVKCPLAEVNDLTFQGTIQKIEKIFKIIYNSVLKIPQISTMLFSSKSNVESIFEVLGLFSKDSQSKRIGSIPSLAKIASNIICELGKSLDYRVIDYGNYWTEILQRFKGVLRSSNSPRVLKSIVHGMILKLLQGCNAESIFEMLQEFLEEEPELGLDQVLMILNSRTRFKSYHFDDKSVKELTNLTPGMEVTLTNDIRNLSYILLPKLPVFYLEKLENSKKIGSGVEVPFYFENKDGNANEKSLIYTSWPVFCVPTKTIVIAHHSIIKPVNLKFTPYGDSGNNSEDEEFITEDEIITLDKIISELKLVDQLKKQRQNEGESNLKSLKRAILFLDISLDNEIKIEQTDLEAILCSIVGENWKEIIRVDKTTIYGEERMDRAVVSSIEEYIQKDEAGWKKTSTRNNRFDELMKKKRTLLNRFSKKKETIFPKPTQRTNSLIRRDIEDNVNPTAKLGTPFLTFSDFGAFNNKEDKLRKKDAEELLANSLKLQVKQFTDSHLSGFDRLYNNHLQLLTRKPKFEKQKLTTQCDEIISQIGGAKEQVALIKELLTKDFDISVDKIEKSGKSLKKVIKQFYIEHLIIFDLAQRVKTKVLSVMVCDHLLPFISSIIQRLKTEVTPQKDNETQIESDPLSIQYFIRFICLIVKNFIALLKSLKNNKTPLDVSSFSAQIENIFTILTISTQKNNEKWAVSEGIADLQTVWNNLGMDIWLHSIGVNKPQIQEKFPKLYKELMILEFAFEKITTDLKDNYENLEASMILISKMKSIDYLTGAQFKESSEKHKIKTILPLLVDYYKPQKIDLRKCDNWFMAYKECPKNNIGIEISTDYLGNNVIFSSGSLELKRRKTIFSNLGEIELPTLPKQELYVHYRYKDTTQTYFCYDNANNFQDILHRHLSTEEGKGNRILNPNYLTTTPNSTMTVINGNLYLFKDRDSSGSYDPHLTGVTHYSGFEKDPNWVYREHLKELVGIWNDSSTGIGKYKSFRYFKEDSNFYSMTSLDLSSLVSSYGQVKSLIVKNDGDGSCFILFESGNLCSVERKTINEDTTPFIFNAKQPKYPIQFMSSSSYINDSEYGVLYLFSCEKKGETYLYLTSHPELKRKKTSVISLRTTAKISQVAFLNETDNETEYAIVILMDDSSLFFLTNKIQKYETYLKKYFKVTERRKIKKEKEGDAFYSLRRVTYKTEGEAGSKITGITTIRNDDQNVLLMSYSLFDKPEHRVVLLPLKEESFTCLKKLELIKSIETEENPTLPEPYSKCFIIDGIIPLLKIVPINSSADKKVNDLIPEPNTEELRYPFGCVWDWRNQNLNYKNLEFIPAEEKKEIKEETEEIRENDGGEEAEKKPEEVKEGGEGTEKEADKKEDTEEEKKKEEYCWFKKCDFVALNSELMSKSQVTSLERNTEKTKKKKELKEEKNIELEKSQLTKKKTRDEYLKTIKELGDKEEDKVQTQTSMLLSIINQDNQRELLKLKSEEIPIVMLGTLMTITNSLITQTKVLKKKKEKKEKRSRNKAKTKETLIEEIEDNQDQGEMLGFIVHRPSTQLMSLYNIKHIKKLCNDYLQSKSKFEEKEIDSNAIQYCYLTDPTLDIKSFTVISSPSENTTEITLVFRGKIKQDFLKSLDKSRVIKIPPAEIAFLPDITRMNKQEWEEVKTDVKEFLQNTDEYKKEKKQEVMENYYKYILSRVGLNPEAEYDCTNSLIQFFHENVSNMYYMSEYARYGIDTDLLDIYIQPVRWISYGLRQFFENTAFIQGDLWESDMLHKFRSCPLRIFTSSKDFIPGIRGKYVTCNRIKGGSTTRDNQKNSLLSQLAYKLGFESEWERALIGSVEITYSGEPGIDAGGLKREYFNELGEEIIQKLGLFIKSPNYKQNLGDQRDCWIPNPSSISETDMMNFTQIGFVMAVCYQKSDILPLNFPNIFWKYLINEPISWSDIKSIDLSIFVCLEKIGTMPDSDLEYLDESFVTYLFDGTEIELKPQGRQIKLNPENKYEYLALVKEKVFSQFIPAFENIRKGFNRYLWNFNTMFANSSMIETDISGYDQVDLDLLKSITNYENCESNHPAVLRFWRVMETLTQKQLSLYLKFVWGRTRLSPSTNSSHKISYYKDKNGIPEAHTCFFELDLGQYKNDDELRKKLIYGIENCQQIAESDSAYSLNADFGMEV